MEVVYGQVNLIEMALKKGAENRCKLLLGY
jgi:hypothetical protein